MHKYTEFIDILDESLKLLPTPYKARGDRFNDKAGNDSVHWIDVYCGTKPIFKIDINEWPNETTVDFYEYDTGYQNFVKTNDVIVNNTNYKKVARGILEKVRSGLFNIEKYKEETND